MTRPEPGTTKMTREDHYGDIDNVLVDRWEEEEAKREKKLGFDDDMFKRKT